MLNRRQISFSFWTLFALAFCFVASSTIMDISTYRAKELSQLIQADVAALGARPELKKYFSAIKNIENQGADPVSSVWAHFAQADLMQQPAGRFKLELLYISQVDEGLKAIVQYHFIDLTTGDSVEEFARYYDLKAFYD